MDGGNVQSQSRLDTADKKASRLLLLATALSGKNECLNVSVESRLNVGYVSMF